MKKEWTVKDGIIGTNHIGRDGQPVDFRPARIKYHPAFGDTITVLPPKGQEGLLEEVKLEALTVEDQLDWMGPDYPHPGMRKVMRTVSASFMGADIVQTQHWGYEWYDDSMKTATLAESRQKEAVRQAHNEAGQIFLQNFPPKSFVERVTASDVSHLRTGVDPGDILVRVLSGGAREAGYDMAMYTVGNEIVRRRKSGEMEEIKNLILVEDQRRREEKKRAWLARQE